ncbi:MAG: tRNA (guanosine(37)-N1)-methyltransferase TrmD [Kofleriaceae bacterium]
MKFSVITVLPELIERALDQAAGGVVGRAREAGVITVETVNPRDFTHDKHRTVDDTPYGGGPGMVMKAEPLLAAIARASGGELASSSGTSGEPSASAASTAGAASTSAASTSAASTSAASTAASTSAASTSSARPHRIFLGPAGAPLTQARVKELAKLPHLVLVCGRYEGIDERVIDIAIDEVLSIGDYVLSGGELAALVVIDACARLVPGVLGESTSADEESHSAGTLEYPQYTRPPTLVSGTAHDVPAILASGNHAAIASWRRQQSLVRTAKRRPDMFARLSLTKADRKLLPPPLAQRTHLALVHYPVVDRHGKLVTSSLTNFDIHDLARSTATYDLAAYHIVTPITSQREKAEHIASLWLDDPATGAPPARKQPTSGSRAGALSRVRTADAVETVIANITTEHGSPPIVVATSARADSFPSARRVSAPDVLAEMSLDPSPLLILLGTGWGLADALIPSVTHILAPIEGGSDWNHLSVRSAGAILLDRLFDKQVGRPA